MSLKNDIKSFLFNFNKRYKLFPWHKVNEYKKYYKNSDIRITVKGKAYSLENAINLINENKKLIDDRKRPSAFSDILNEYQKCVTEESDRAYSLAKRKCQKRFDELIKLFQDTFFILKEINKQIKSIKKEYANMDEYVDIMLQSYLAEEAFAEKIKNNKFFLEETNSDIAAKFKEGKSEFKKSVDKARDLVKKEKYKEAINELEHTKKLLNSYIKYINENTSDSVGTTICGYGYPFLIFLGRSLVTGLGRGLLAMLGIPYLGPLEVVIINGGDAILHAVAEMTNIISNIKDKNHKFSLSDLNRFKNRSAGYLKMCIKYIDNFEKAIKKKMNSEKSDTVKESVDFYGDYFEDNNNEDIFNDTKRALYEKCSRGEITVDERERKLARAREILL